MNTERSDNFVRLWKEDGTKLKKGGFTAVRKFNASPEKLFPLFCPPTTEYDWLPGWKCELLHSESGYMESNAIFRTDYFGFDEVWFCADYQPSRRIECIRVSQDITIRFEINVADHFDETCTAVWIITFFCSE